MNAPARDARGQFLGRQTRPAKKRRDIEGGIQRSFADWCRFMLRDDVLWFSVPNESKRSPAYAAKLKAQGLRPGAADFAVIFEGRYHAIEFKAPREYQTEAQKEFADLCAASGAVYGVARSLIEAIALLDEWNIPHKEKRR